MSSPATLPPAAASAAVQTPRPARRDHSVDILRGWAIFTMIAANMAGSTLAEPHPFLFRFYGTFAAPTFILISGMMTATGCAKQDRGLRYYLVRGGLTMLFGAMLDWGLWRNLPFVEVDVLYLLGLAMPIVYLAMKVGHATRWILMAALFAAAPLMQLALGYQPFPLGADGEADAWTIARHWMVDGWFPAFPWLGFALLGANLAEPRRRLGDFRKTAFLLGSLALLIGGAVLWWVHPGELYTRGGYSEMFYPPTYGFMLTATGVVFVQLCLVDRFPGLSLFDPLRALGQVALFIYVLHYTCIRFILIPLLGRADFGSYALAYAVFATLMIGVAYALRALKRAHPPQGFFARFLLGG